MSEINCKNCQAACCRANEIVSLTLEEASFMLRGGNKLITVAQPSDHDREKVLYPRGHELDEETGRIIFFAEKGNEYEPLAAGLGRYVLTTDCAYLRTDESGWDYCGAYDERPKVCSDFEVGGEKCQIMRVLRGVDPVPVSIRGSIS